ncbi:MAG: hypothetical protein ABMA64_43165 [Myxococcota bacterium]
MGFQVDKVYYLPHRDLVVIAGRVEGAPPRAGGSIDLPRQINGPGWVPVHDLQTVAFADGDRLCVILDYQVLEGAPLMEFSALEGLILDVRNP